MKLYAISDLHGKLDFKVPSCDLLLVGGDVCPDFAPGTSYGSSMQEQWLHSKWLNWLDEQSIGHTFATFGNHDFTRKKESPTQFKVDEFVEYTKIGMDRSLKIWFSPWSNTFGGWAWMADPDKLKVNYDLIPENVDIIVSHQPPYGFGDEVDGQYSFGDEDRHVGSKELLKTLDRVKPKVVICGHIHSGHGTYTYTRPDGGATTIYNVSLVNEQYQRVYEPTEIIL